MGNADVCLQLESVILISFTPALLRKRPAFCTPRQPTCVCVCFFTVYVMFMCYNGQKQRGHISEEADQLSIEGTELCAAGISHVLDCGAESFPAGLQRVCETVTVDVPSYPQQVTPCSTGQGHSPAGFQCHSLATLAHLPAESFLSQETIQKDQVSSSLCSGKICSERGELRASFPKAPGEAVCIRGNCVSLSPSVCSVVLIKCLETVSCSSALSSEELPETYTSVVNTPAM